MKLEVISGKGGYYLGVRMKGGTPLAQLSVEIFRTPYEAQLALHSGGWCLRNTEIHQHIIAALKESGQLNPEPIYLK